MKFIRWVLSHLTLITVLSLIVYVYWNRSEFWPDKVEKSPRIEASDVWTDSGKAVKGSGVKIVDKNRSESETSSLKYGNIVMKSLGDDNTLQYPSDVADADNVTKKSRNQDFDVVNIKNPEIDSSKNHNEDSSYSAPADFTEPLKRYKQGIAFKQQKALENANKVFQQSAEESVKYPGEEEINNANIKPKAGTFQDKKLQAQIRARQKQLQNQMVSLIPVKKKKGEDYDKLTGKKNSEVKSVLPPTEQ